MNSVRVIVIGELPWKQHLVSFISSAVTHDEVQVQHLHLLSVSSLTDRSVPGAKSMTMWPVSDVSTHELYQRKYQIISVPS